MLPTFLPVRPDILILQSQASDLIEACLAGNERALYDWRHYAESEFSLSFSTIDDARNVLAKAYGLPNWARLALACEVTDSIWREDKESVTAIISQSPYLLHEDARGVKGNWGPPLSYAATVGSEVLVKALLELGAQDIQYAFDRATLKGHLQIADILHTRGAVPERGCIMGPCETLNAEGLGYLLSLGAAVEDPAGNVLAPTGLVLQTYCRNPEGKHACLALLEKAGVTMPNTPPMALHAGRLDLLEQHLQRDPKLLSRKFAHREIFPVEMGCDSDESLALHGTPLHGTTLLHMAVDYDETEIVHWLLRRGANVNEPAYIDDNGFGGHTALYGTVVSQPFRVGLRRDDSLAKILLEAGANPKVRASLRKRLRFVDDETIHEYQNVTPSEWGRQFHDQAWVSGPALALIDAAANGSTDATV